MPVPTTAADLSTTAASNSPAGADAIGTSLDDYMRSIQAIIKQQDSKGSDIASTTTIDVPSSGKYFVVTGTTTIAGISDDWNGRMVVLKFSGALQLTHSAAFILPSAANITTVAGDCLMAVNESTGVWRVVEYQRSTGAPVAGGGDHAVMGFRLTLSSGTAVTLTDVTGATTIYCSPYKGKKIGLYDGSVWNIRESAEFSLALGTLTSALPYDVFCYDNSGTPTLEFLAWTNDTTRATALAYQDGVLVKSGAATRRYLGTFYTTSTTTTEDSSINRYLWNYYNRCERKLQKVDATASWNYTTATNREANGGNNRVNIIVGREEDIVSVDLTAYASNTSAGVALVIGIGLDSTTTRSADCPGETITTISAGVGIQLSTFYRGFVGTGKHSLVRLEYSVATGTTTWYGDRGLFGSCMS